MCSHGTLLEKFDPVELAMNPLVPDVPGDLLLLAHSVEFSFRDLRSQLSDVRARFNFYFKLWGTYREDRWVTVVLKMLDFQR